MFNILAPCMCELNIPSLPVLVRCFTSLVFALFFSLKIFTKIYQRNYVKVLLVNSHSLYIWLEFLSTVKSVCRPHAEPNSVRCQWLRLAVSMSTIGLSRSSLTEEKSEESQHRMKQLWHQILLKTAGSILLSSSGVCSNTRWEFILPDPTV